MQLFEKSIQKIRKILFENEDILINKDYIDNNLWHREKHTPLVLEQDTAVELGSDNVDSFATIVWSEDPKLINDGVISCYGKDISQIYDANGLCESSFGKIVVLNVNTLPEEDIYSYFDFQVLGSELIRDYKSLPFVDGAEIIFCTDAQVIKKLKPFCDECTKIARALNKIFDDITMNCGDCGFSDVCNEVDDLKKLHQNQKSD